MNITSIEEFLEEKYGKGAIKEAINETIINYKEVDREGIVDTIVTALSNSEELFNEVVVDEERGWICIKDSQDIKYNIEVYKVS